MHIEQLVQYLIFKFGLQIWVLNTRFGFYHFQNEWI